MILVLLGGNPYCFKRIIKEIDLYSINSGQNFLIQIGFSRYIPQHNDYFRFKPHNEIIDLINSSEFVITQGGYGSIYDCLKLKKKVIAVPRDGYKNECLDPGLGQYELVQYLEKQNRILVLYDESQLAKKIEELPHFKPNFDFVNNLSEVVSNILNKEIQMKKKSKIDVVNILRNVFPWFFKNRIIEITLFVTDKCNFRCKHCFMLDQLNKKNDSFLSLNEFKLMGNYINSLQRVHIGGGEPLTRNDISDVILTIANQWNTKVICLPTNGSFQKNAEITAELFGKKSKNHLRFHFSLSTTNDQMEVFTGYKQAFQLWDKTIKSVKRITQKFSNISLIVLSSYNDFNQNNIEELIDYVRNEVKPDDFSFGLVRSHNNYNPNLDLEKFKAINHKIFNETKAQSPFIRAYRELIRSKITQYYEDKRYHVRCLSGKLRVVISPDGFVYPCENLGYPEGANQEDWNMGNIRDYNYNIHKLLKGEKARTVRQKIRVNKCHCHHGVDMSINYLCTWTFKFEVLFLGLKYSFQK